MDDRVVAKRRYTAGIDTESVIQDALHNGIKPYFGVDYVPLATTYDDAVMLFMTELVEHKMSEPRYIAVFCIDLPAGMKLERVKYKNSDVSFYRYEGTLPPEYIKDVEDVEVERVEE